MGDVLPFAGFAHAVTLDRLRQDHRRLALMFNRSRIGGVHFGWVVAAAVQAPDILI